MNLGSKLQIAIEKKGRSIRILKILWIHTSRQDPMNATNGPVDRLTWTWSQSNSLHAETTKITVQSGVTHLNPQHSRTLALAESIAQTCLTRMWSLCWIATASRALIIDSFWRGRTIRGCSAEHSKTNLANLTTKWTPDFGWLVVSKIWYCIPFAMGLCCGMRNAWLSIPSRT